MEGFGMMRRQIPRLGAQRTRDAVLTAACAAALANVFPFASAAETKKAPTKSLPPKPFDYTPPLIRKTPQDMVDYFLERYENSVDECACSPLLSRLEPRI